MNRDHFWLTDDQFGRLEPLLPRDTRGKPRVDDRRVISGIIHVLKSGGRLLFRLHTTLRSAKLFHSVTHVTGLLLIDARGLRSIRL